ncbi:Transcription factor [Trichinella spiralis]|uniref:Transcription factor n=1 Tax=Trichinella spiralis TaxID=6334 RepID=A0ABR3K6D8_TRISP
MTGQNNDRRSSYIASDSLPRGRHCVRFFPNACVLVLRLLSESSSLVFSVLCTLPAKVDWIVCIGSKNGVEEEANRNRSTSRVYILDDDHFFLGREIFYNFEQEKATNQAGSSGVVQSIPPPPLCSRF